MQPRTEDLLTLRDGEPIEATLKARLLADPSTAAGLQRLGSRRDALRALPPVLPNDAAAARILAAMEAARAKHRRRPGRRGAALAASLVAAVLIAIALRPSPVAETQVAAVPPSAGTQPAEEPVPDSGLGTEASAPDYLALIEESVRLERALSLLPAQRMVMRGGTAGTIAGLEDQIALIDAQLTLAAGGAEPQYQAELWRERVDVMHALVQVRYAQSRMFVF